MAIQYSLPPHTQRTEKEIGYSLMMTQRALSYEGPAALICEGPAAPATTSIEAVHTRAQAKDIVERDRLMTDTVVVALARGLDASLFY